MKTLLLRALMLTVVVMAIRILLEELGAPGAISNLFGVAWLHILVPLYFGIRWPATEYSYRHLVGAVAVYTVAARFLVVISYSLAYLLGWSAFRFSVEGGGVVGAGVAPLDGLLLIPAGNQPFWIIAGIAVGTLVGSLALLVSRRRAGA